MKTQPTKPTQKPAVGQKPASQAGCGGPTATKPASVSAASKTAPKRK